MPGEHVPTRGGDSRGQDVTVLGMVGHLLSKGLDLLRWHLGIRVDRAESARYALQGAIDRGRPLLPVGVEIALDQAAASLIEYEGAPAQLEQALQGVPDEGVP